MWMDTCHLYGFYASSRPRRVELNESKSCQNMYEIRLDLGKFGGGGRKSFLLLLIYSFTLELDQIDGMIGIRN